MVSTELHVRREDNLVVLITMNRDISPVQHRLDHRGGIDHLHTGLDPGTAGEYCYTYRPLETVPQFGLPYPNSLATVRIVFRRPIHQHIAAGPVMIRNVPLNSTREPCAQHTDQSRLDSSPGIEEIVVVRQVLSLINPSTDLGKDAETYVVVLQLDDLIGLVNHLVSDDIIQRIGIDVTFRSLVDAASEEDGIDLRGSELMSGDCLFLNFQSDLLAE